MKRGNTFVYIILNFALFICEKPTLPSTSWICFQSAEQNNQKYPTLIVICMKYCHWTLSQQQSITALHYILTTDKLNQACASCVNTLSSSISCILFNSFLEKKLPFIISQKVNITWSQKFHIQIRLGKFFRQKCPKFAMRLFPWFICNSFK